jgi:hypothetical protein
VLILGVQLDLELGLVLGLWLQLWLGGGSMLRLGLGLL